MTTHEAPPLPHASLERRPPARLYAFGVFVVLATVLAAGWVVYARRSAVAADAAERKQAAAAGTPVLVAPVRRMAPGRTLTLPGEVKPWRQATLYAKVSGYVRSIAVDKGDRVANGQRLAELESPETDQQVRSARADLATKKVIADRYQVLAPKGVVSQQDLDQASGNLAVAQAELARTSALEAYETIRAPFDGAVTGRFVDPGALLPAATGSTSSAQPLLEVTDMSRLRIYVYLGQGDALFVREGMPVKLESEARPGRSVDASVTRITRELDPRTRTMLTEIDVDNVDGWAYPGLFLRVTMSLETPPGLSVPAESVFLRDGRAHVAVVDRGHARFAAIETGDDDGRVVRVLSGLNEGDLVILHVGDEVTDGAVVRPVTSPAPSAESSAPRR